MLVKNATTAGKKALLKELLQLKSAGQCPTRVTTS